MMKSLSAWLMGESDLMGIPPLPRNPLIPFRSTNHDATHQPSTGPTYSSLPLHLHCPTPGPEDTRSRLGHISIDADTFFHMTLSLLAYRHHVLLSRPADHTEKLTRRQPH